MTLEINTLIYKKQSGMHYLWRVASLFETYGLPCSLWQKQYDGGVVPIVVCHPKIGKRKGRPLYVCDVPMFILVPVAHDNYISLTEYEKYGYPVHIARTYREIVLIADKYCKTYKTYRLYAKFKQFYAEWQKQKRQLRVQHDPQIHDEHPTMGGADIQGQGDSTGFNG